MSLLLSCLLLPCAAAADGTVSFSRDLAHVLDQSCTSCHGTDRPRARLSLATFAGLMRGGDNGPPVQAGNPDDSLLIQKLKGTAEGQRMPQGNPPLADEVIARFETWIRQGARFDGRDENQDVREIAAISRAELASHEELRGQREQLAQANWRLAMPDDAPRQVQTEHFLLLGNLDEEELGQYGAVAEQLVPKIAKVFRAEPDQPLVKGGMTLFLFESGYDYSELARMVEKRDVPQRARAHCRYSIVDAYAALHVGRDDPDSLEASLTQQIAGLYVSSLGPSPTWFRRAVATATAARLVPRSDLVVGWNEQLDGAFRRLQQPADFLQGRTTAADGDVLAYSFAAFLMSDSRRFQRLIGALRGGTAFERAFSESYGAGPEQVAQVWARRTAAEIQRRSRRSRSGR